MLTHLEGMPQPENRKSKLYLTVFVKRLPTLILSQIAYQFTLYFFLYIYTIISEETSHEVPGLFRIPPQKNKAGTTNENPLRKLQKRMLSVNIVVCKV